MQLVCQDDKYVNALRSSYAEARMESVYTLPRSRDMYFYTGSTFDHDARKLATSPLSRESVLFDIANGEPARLTMVFSNSRKQDDESMLLVVFGQRIIF